MQATLLTSFSDIDIQLKAAQSALYPDAILLSGVANTPSWRNRRRVKRQVRVARSIACGVMTIFDIVPAASVSLS